MAAAQKPNPFTGFSPSGGLSRRRAVFLLFASAFLLFLVSTIIAWRQEPRPDPFQPASFLSFDWWCYPLERNAFKRLPVIPANLNAVVAVPGTDQMWAVGSGGMIVHSADGGRTWKQRKIALKTDTPQEQPDQPAPAKGAFLGLPDFVPSAYANGGKSQAQQAPQYQEPPQENAPLKTEPAQQKQPTEQLKEQISPVANESVAPKSETPKPRPETADLSDVHFINEQEGWVVGGELFGDSAILHTTNGGRSWQPQSSGVTTHLHAIHMLADGRQGWIVGTGGPILHTTDGGQSWQPQSSGGTTWLYAIHMLADGQQGWVVGWEGTILHTTDGGQSWQPQSSGVTTDLCAIHMLADGRQGWVVGGQLSGDSAILHTTNGGQSWQPQSSGATVRLESIHMLADGRQGWIVGWEGTILHTTDGGQSWQPQSSGVTVGLESIHMLADGRQGWIVGFDDTILHTTDGGATWIPQTRGKRDESEERSIYHIGFAPWYYLFGWLLPCTLCAVALAYYAKAPPPEEQSVADNLVSDRPLEAGDPDPLGFTTTALGLSRFLRNEKTQPPLTVAIIGEWGSGKSSLMNLLKADLAQRGFRPVWFNAWHHQQEEQLLAALLESVRRQSVPPWWHPHGVAFRLRLLSLRSRQHLLVFIPLLIALAFSLGYIIAHPQSPGEALQQAQQWLETSISWVKAFAPHETTAQTGAQTAPSGGAGSQPQSLFALLTSLFISLVALRKGLTVFGVDPATLLASMSDNARVRDLGAQVSFRQKFAAEFRDVTKALHPRTMLVLIDDLDRCRPDKVLEVLEAINFLVSSGECYVVMGMALERVERCVGLGFKDVAEELMDTKEGDQNAASTTEEGKKKRAAFARQYLEKLINIEVPVPTLTNDQSAQLLNTNTQPVAEQNTRNWRNLLTLAMLKRLAPWTVLVLALVYSFWFGFRIENAPTPQPTATPAATSTPTAESQQASTPKAEQEPQFPKDKEQPKSTAVFIPGQQSHPSPWLPLAPVAAVIAAWTWFALRERQEVVVKDSPEFVEALKIWLPLITAKQNTPRSVKRFLNKVRYLAMRQRPQEKTARSAVAAQTNGNPDEDGTSMPESTLVALSAMQHCYPEKLNDQNFFLKLNELQKDERIVRKENGYQNPMRLNKALEEHEKKFTDSLEFQPHWNKFVEISKGIRVS